MTHNNNSAERHTFLGMDAVIASKGMRAVLDTAQRVARSNASVLILGESGSGKELVARAIHHYSARNGGPWVDLNCGAIPEHLLESELFGYERGAFSGADSSKPGLFELAHLGTIFLDEIADLDPRMQVKLLRVLDGVPYYRLGGTRKLSVDVRVVAATNQNLEASVEQGRFRSDLYHRLNQFSLHVPPLRERVEDIAPLARHFLAQQDQSYSFTQSAIALMEAQAWPGNIRQLRNAVISAVVWATGDQIDIANLPNMPPYARPANELETKIVMTHLERLEKQAILGALSATGGHQQKAAAQLGISRRTLHRKLKQYGPQEVSTAL